MKKSNILSTYTNEQGQLVVVLKPYKPRKGEKTWLGAAKYSLSNLGGKANTLRNAGLPNAKG
jgi:hypothetical protein